MVIGLGTDHIYVASETAAFNRHTKNFIAMQDGEIAVITPTECSLDKARMEQVSSRSRRRDRRELIPTAVPVAVVVSSGFYRALWAVGRTQYAGDGYIIDTVSRSRRRERSPCRVFAVPCGGFCRSSG